MKSSAAPSLLPALAALVAVVILLSSVPACSAQDQAQQQGGQQSATAPPPPTRRVPEPSSPSLTVEQFVYHLQSEAAEEFSYVEEVAESRNVTLAQLAEDANVQWSDAISFEWERCAMEEDALGKRCPFVVCHRGGHGDGRFDRRRMSGNKRREKVVEAIRLAAISSGGVNVTDEENVFNDPAALAAAAAVHLVTLSNVAEEWCGFVRLNESIAENVTCSGDGFDRDEECSVTPLIMSMKMMPRTVGVLLEAIEGLEEREEDNAARNSNGTVQDDGKSESDWDDLPKADVYLCPGVISQEDIDGYAARDESTEGVDFTEGMTSWLLERTGSAADTANNGTNGNATESAVAEALYWTSSRADAYASSGDTARAAFWNRVFDLTLRTTACDDTYRTKLSWSADLYPPPGFSILTVTYDNRYDDDDDKWCIVAMIAGLATNVDVCTVEIRQKVDTANTEAAWMVQAGGVQGRTPWYDAGLDGTGQVVAVSDTGLDRDNCYFWDLNHGGPTKERDNAHRKIVEYHPFTDTTDYQYGHGTHVCGTVAGRRAGQGAEESDGAADGIARGAKIAFADLGDASGALYLPGDTALLSVGRNGGAPLASIHSASWGSTTNYYNSQARNFDNFMFENDDFLINVAAGNDGRGDAPNTVGAPATFKNGISVGAAHSTGPDLKRDMLGPAYVADFSSRGPTADGRMKPEIIAPGKYILSAGAQPNQVGECDSGGGVPEAGGSAAGLTSMAGTSMATPVVSGTAALIRQYFEDGFYPAGRRGSGSSKSVSGALVKAVLLNGAQTHNVKGVDNGGGKVTPVVPYDNTQGFGRIDLTKSLYIEGWTDVQAKVWDRQVVVDGAPRRFVVTMDASQGCAFDQMSATLVWVEPGSVVGCTKCVTNDLDLLVTRNSDGAAFYPNGLKGKDSTNNAERVIVPNVGGNESFTLEVTAYNLDGPQQTFALVATGCFGGVPNTMDTAQNVFNADTSAEDYNDTTRLIVIICSSIGGAILLCLGCFCCYKRRAAVGDKDDDDDERTSIRDSP